MEVINAAIYRLENSLYAEIVDQYNMNTDKVIKISNALSCLYELKRKKQELIKGEKEKWQKDIVKNTQEC